MRVSREISDFRGAIQHRGRDFTTGESVERHRTDREPSLSASLRKAENVRGACRRHHASCAKPHGRYGPGIEGDPFNCGIRI